MATMYFYYTPFIVLPLLSAIVNAGLAAYCWRHRQISAARPLFWLMVGMSGWSCAYAFNTVATSLDVKVFCFKIGASFVCLIGPSVLALALESIGQGAWLTRRRLVLVSTIPIISLLLVWTNDFHFLFRYDLHLFQSGPLLLLGFKDGPYYPVHLLYVLLANGVAIVLFAFGFRTAKHSEWQRFALMMLATALSMLVECLQLTPVKGFSMTTSSLFLAGTFYFAAIFRHRLLAVVPLARNTLFDLIGEPVLVFDHCDKLVDCNYSAHLLADCDYTEGVDGVYRKILARLPLLDILTNQGFESSLEEDHTDAIDPSRYWRTSTSLVLASGRLRGRLVLLHEISNLKQAERKLTESERQLQELNNSLQERIEDETKRRIVQERMLANQSRLAAMGDMIGAIAHQWRQPLATLGMIVQRTHAMGTMQKFSPEYLDEFKANAMRQVRYMSETIEEFRGFYRIEKQKEAFSPGSCISDAVRLFEPQFAASNIEVAITCHDCSDQLIQGFPNEFKQVILNLLGNARDAIILRSIAEGTPNAGHIGVNISIKGKSAMHIDVSDNGCGIPYDIGPRIFDPYFTTKEESGGTGIGLYMSRMIVEDSLNGRLSLLESLRGAVFRIELPLENTP